MKIDEYIPEPVVESMIGIIREVVKESFADGSLHPNQALGSAREALVLIGPLTWDAILPAENWLAERFECEE